LVLFGFFVSARKGFLKKEGAKRKQLAKNIGESLSGVRQQKKRRIQELTLVASGGVCWFGLKNQTFVKY
jgi:hypothetical protein